MRRALLAVALAGSVAFVAAPASAMVCPPATQTQPVYHPFTGQRIATICVPVQH